MNVCHPAVLVAVGVALAAAAGAQERALHHTVDEPALQWSPCPELMPDGCELTVLHGDTAQPNADVLLRIPPRSQIPRHWHSSAERMILIAGELEVDFDGQPATTLRAGNYGYGPARLPHSAHCRSAEPCLLFVAFEDPVDMHAGAPGEGATGH
jgi:quercetin dioxygenase-like cupin family protein